jgi:transposase InsO family protein
LCARGDLPGDLRTSCANIETVAIDPGKPWQNGLNESFNGKGLEIETTDVAATLPKSFNRNWPCGDSMTSHGKAYCPNVTSIMHQSKLAMIDRGAWHRSILETIL